MGTTFGLFPEIFGTSTRDFYFAEISAETLAEIFDRLGGDLRGCFVLGGFLGNIFGFLKDFWEIFFY